MSLLAEDVVWDAQPGVSGTVAVVVAGAGPSPGPWVVEVSDGRPVAVEAVGTPPVDVDLTLTVTPADGEAILAGTLPPSVAFMQGRLKTAGDNGLVLGVLATTAGPAFAAWRAQL